MLKTTVPPARRRHRDGGRRDGGRRRPVRALVRQSSATGACAVAGGRSDRLRLHHAPAGHVAGRSPARLRRLPHAFERLWRGRDAARIGGTGIGLAVVRELAIAHGGAVTIDSPPRQRPHRDPPAATTASHRSLARRRFLTADRQTFVVLVHRYQAARPAPARTLRPGTGSPP
ncbi:sensor histidine kinase [Actinoplanes sp. KI2]|uniref:ATP-binding protein n=1 Tax=Actinoplanes sp. KI2 TaxID=2983315 RepID=UPI0039839FC6